MRCIFNRPSTRAYTQTHTTHTHKYVCKGYLQNAGQAGVDSEFIHQTTHVAHQLTGAAFDANKIEWVAVAVICGASRNDGYNDGGMTLMVEGDDGIVMVES